jgi:hypothetical protein
MISLLFLLLVLVDDGGDDRRCSFLFMFPLNAQTVNKPNGGTYETTQCRTAKNCYSEVLSVRGNKAFRHSH